MSSAANSHERAGRRIRRDGWTPERQLRFLDVLAATRSVTRAAAAVGMSRKSAYRLRGRADGALFAAAWDRTLRAPRGGAGKPRKRLEGHEGHIARDRHFAELLRRLSREGHETDKTDNPGDPKRRAGLS